MVMYLPTIILKYAFDFQISELTNKRGNILPTPHMPGAGRVEAWIDCYTTTRLRYWSKFYV